VCRSIPASRVRASAPPARPAAAAPGRWRRQPRRCTGLRARRDDARRGAPRGAAWRRRGVAGAARRSPDGRGRGGRRRGDDRVRARAAQLAAHDACAPACLIARADAPRPAAPADRRAPCPARRGPRDRVRGGGFGAGVPAHLSRFRLRSRTGGRHRACRPAADRRGATRPCAAGGASAPPEDRRAEDQGSSPRAAQAAATVADGGPHYRLAFGLQRRAGAWVVTRLAD
jgi:hypothetical protein